MATIIPLLAKDLFPLKQELVDHATGGDNEIVAAVAGKRIAMISCLLISTGITTVRFESGTTGDNFLTGQMSTKDATGFMAPAQSDSRIWIPYWITNEGESLNIQLSAAVSVDGSVQYIEV